MLDSMSGVLSGTPTANGTFNFTVTATDTMSGCSGSQSYSITVNPATPVFRCPLPQGYWKNNPGAWAVNSLMLGSKTYTKPELLTILNTSARSDASIILAYQLIAAKLNIANGSDPAPISSTIANADSLLSAYAGKLPYSVKTSSAAGKAMVNAANMLERYNNGLLTPVCNPTNQAALEVARPGYSFWLSNPITDLNSLLNFGLFKVGTGRDRAVLIENNNASPAAGN